jgi:hypothetical protein
MNKRLHHFQIINGTFTPDQARQVLGAMVKSKIDYHTLDKCSEGERSGITDPSEERLQSLLSLAAELKALFESAETCGKQLKTKGIIEIMLIE